MSKPVAKSLHTVTVLMQLARSLQASGERYTGPNVAIDEAMGILSLNGRPDPHGLRAKAVALMERGA